MALQNITDSALLVSKSRRTIQRYIASGKLTVVSDALGKTQIDTSELIRVFGTLSKVSKKILANKSRNVAATLSKKNNTIHLTPAELEDIINRAVERALSKAMPLLLEHKKTSQIVEEIIPTPPIGDKKIKPILPINKPVIVERKERKNGYATAFGLPNVITEVIHLQIMKLHGEGLTSREIEKKVSVSLASIQRTINVSA